MTLSNEAVALLRLIASKKQGRVSYALCRRDAVFGYASPLLAAGFIKPRRLGYDEGFQITDAGKAYLCGEQP